MKKCLQSIREKCAHLCSGSDRIASDFWAEMMESWQWSENLAVLIWEENIYLAAVATKFSLTGKKNKEASEQTKSKSLWYQ